MKSAGMIEEDARIQPARLSAGIAFSATCKLFRLTGTASYDKLLPSYFTTKCGLLRRWPPVFLATFVPDFNVLQLLISKG
jgi:hypothetical protein